MDRRIQFVVSHLESHISAHLYLAELAKQVNLSSSRLRHLFKNETGQTPAQYLKQLRMQRAELLLRTTFLSVKEIVNKVGLTDSSSFVREFKKMHKLPPTSYRRAVMQDARATFKKQ